MELASAKPCSTNHPRRFAQSEAKDTPRCSHLTAGGRRCRLAVLDTRTNLCFRHSALLAAAAQPHLNDSEDLSADLLPELSEFNSGVNINKFLARLLVLVTKGRISPRRASVLAYITNQLLHSNRAVILENKALDNEPQQIIIDIPGPNRGEPRPDNPTYADLRS